MHGGIDIPGVELLDELGRGAHGAVYRARRGTECYAVKVALAASDPSAFVRFQREAIALARAKHPGLPRVLDVAKSGAPYLVMELVEGETLAARLSRGTLSEEETRSLGLQLADVLGHIHRLGLVHRDVKPRNIIFDEKSGRARIVDFGIAIGTASTNFAAAEGTVPYAAPEQLRGLGIDGRADLYSLGCVLYECLCGMPPFGPLNLSRLGKADPISDEARLERSGISPELARAIVQLVSPEARLRHGDADQVMDALRLTSANASDSSGASRSEPLLANPGAVVGRKSELAMLDRAWSEVVADCPSVLEVQGVMGSGKTTLLSSFCERVRTEGHASVHVTCSLGDSVPFSVARKIFDELLDHFGDEAFRRAVAGFESLLVVISPSLRRVFPDAAAVPDADDVHHVVLESAAKCLHGLLALERKVVLCIDDCQWIDAGSSAILLRLFTSSRTARLVILAYRSAPSYASELDALRGNGPLVELGTFGEEAIRTLVGQYLGADEVSPEIANHVTILSAPTPLGALEAVRTLLEDRAILPSWSGWQLQPEVAEAVRLPNSVVETLRARIAGLERMVPEVLAGAAVIGMEFDVALLAEVLGYTQDEVYRVIREACRATLVTGGPTACRFVHQAVRDALLASCTDGKLRDLSARAAEALDRELQGADVGFELVYRVADLYWRGDWGHTAERAIEVIEEAAQRAFEAYDNRQALIFVERAAEIRAATGKPAGGPTLYLHGEALVRLGSLAAGRALLEKALEASKERLHRANILWRIAWVCEWELDSDKAWSTLRLAFKELGAEFPGNSAASFARSGGALLRQALGRVQPLAGRDATERQRQKILCSLYYRTFRISALSADVSTTIQAALLGLEAAQSLGVSAALSRAYMAYSFVLIVLGQKERGRRYLEQSYSVARAVDDPVALAHAMQVHSVIACWDGDITKALDIGARCLNEHGHWLDFSEHCHLAYNQCKLECVRGRGQEELAWVEHLLRQVEQNPEAYGLFEFILLGARGLFGHLGRAEEGERKLGRLAAATVRIPRASSYYVLSFAGRARLLTDTGESERELEALDVEFRHERHDPRRVHLSVAEYYVHIAHARVHFCLRAPEAQRPAYKQRLERAADDLRLAARIPMLRCHSLVVDAYVAFFGGDDERCCRLFAEADAMAIDEQCPWVRYAVARGRAHRFKQRSNLDVMQSEARRAEEIARENGSVYRLRWIRDEFGLPQTSSVFTVPTVNHPTGLVGIERNVPTTSRRKQRSGKSKTLRKVDHPPPHAQEKVELLVDELIGAIGASEVHLFLQRQGGVLEPVFGRSSAEASVAVHPVDDFVRDAANRGRGLVVDDTDVLRSRMVVPTVVDRDDVESLLLYAEAPGCGAFDADDYQLATQAGERLLSLPSGLSAAKSRRVEAGVSAPSSSDVAGALLEHVEHLAAEEASGAELLGRITTLSRLLQETKRLARHEPTAVNLNDVVTKAVRRLRALIGGELEVLTALESPPSPVFVDPEHVELLIVHAALGVHRRMLNDGTLVLETSSAVMEDNAPSGRHGAHAVLTISAIRDVQGDHLQRASVSAGCLSFGSLALRMAAEVAATNAGALIAHEESVSGANLQLSFPCTQAGAVTGTRQGLAGTERILLIERDERLRKELAAELRRYGYRVVIADDLEVAARMTEIHGGAIDLSVIETTLEASNPRGLQLPEARTPAVLYTSHFPWNALRASGIGLPRSQFLQKPYSSGMLLGKIRALLDEGVQRKAVRGVG